MLRNGNLNKRGIKDYITEVKVNKNKLMLNKFLKILMHSIEIIE